MKYLLTLTLLIIIFIIILLIFCDKYLKYIIDPKKLSISLSRKLAEKNKHLDFIKEENIKEYILSMNDNYSIPVYYIKNESDKFVILSHGHTVTHYNSFKYAEIFYDLGYNIVMYDSRGHGSNNESIISLGYFESEDLNVIIQDTYQRYGKDIFLGIHGESMGAITSNLVLKHKPDLKFIISDSSFKNAVHHLKYFVKKMYKLPSFLIYFGDIACYLHYHFFLSNINPDKYIRENEVPICFIHGLKDDYILAENTESLYAINKGYKELYLFENANHARCLQSDPVKYRTIIKNFTERVEKQDEGKDT